jgi:glucitol operon activator protein
MSTPLLLLAAVVAGWIVQAVMTFRQSTSFNKAAHDLRSAGTVAVGVGGRPYRGGRAYVALAVDDQNRVVKAVTLSGWTTFARPHELPAVVGSSVNRLRRAESGSDLSAAQALAVRNAAETLQHRQRQQS